MFTGAEIAYLLAQRLGRLATIQPGGTLQVSPVCYTFAPETGCFDVAGIEMASSQKFRNVSDNGSFIRIRPEQIISFGIGDDRDPHELAVHNRRVGEDA